MLAWNQRSRQSRCTPEARELHDRRASSDESIANTEPETKSQDRYCSVAPMRWGSAVGDPGPLITAMSSEVELRKQGQGFADQKVP